MATYKPADLNKDGEVTDRERRRFKKQADTDGDGQVSPKERKAFAAANPDPLSAEELAADYDYAYRVLMSDPELAALLERATAGQWQPAKFQAELMTTDWWNTNNEYAREAYAARAMGGADWEATLEDARNLVQQRATALGARLSQQDIDSYAEQAISSGWNRAGRQSLLDQAISSKISGDEYGTFRGEAGNLQDRLRMMAQANGLQLSNTYYESAARSVASGLTTEEDWLREVRQQAASLWPSWSEKIMAGMDARTLADGYINLMSQTFEMMPDQISLDDPYIRQAMTGTDDQGNPKPMGLFDFQQKLRQDPRWMGTKQAEDQVSNIANDVLRMFGFVGS